MIPALQSDVLPVPQPLVNYSLSVDDEYMPSCNHESKTEMDYIPMHKYLKPHKITKVDLNDLVSDLRFR